MLKTVCQPNVTDYQCICEDGYVWSYNNCQRYEACGDISFGSCGCISGIPSDGEMCVLESGKNDDQTSQQQMHSKKSVKMFVMIIYIKKKFKKLQYK